MELYLKGIAILVQMVTFMEVETIPSGYINHRQIASPMIYISMVYDIYRLYNLDTDLICESYNQGIDEIGIKIKDTQLFKYDKEIFENIIHLLEKYEISLNTNMTKNEEFIYWYLDCSFFMIDDKISNYCKFVKNFKKKDGDEKNV